MKHCQHIAILLAILLPFIVNITHAGRYSPTPPPAGGLNLTYGPGTALAAASGTCVKDWNVGIQKCISWAMVDPEGIDPVHGFGGGITTRLDQFSIHFWGGIEDISGDETTILFTGSINFR